MSFMQIYMDKKNYFLLGLSVALGQLGSGGIFHFFKAINQMAGTEARITLFSAFPVSSLPAQPLEAALKPWCTDTGVCFSGRNPFVQCHTASSEIRLAHPEEEATGATGTKANLDHHGNISQK